ncbi:hypothetical protein FDP41_007144 [Naegleria fowleri]|uniref:Uncharacterized protein n=1 Tax=Naegleria fowleri TaxID=5763 RepID=A0A6A5B8N2_NAEFO|nr:uncharacterized protein FDP41_007144 [Naegleria fowleri]KAF0973757.1 hypothetical protein FDP41_007144 [Naegleria fowleri]
MGQRLSSSKDKSSSSSCSSSSSSSEGYLSSHKHCSSKNSKSSSSSSLSTTCKQQVLLTFGLEINMQNFKNIEPVKFISMASTTTIGHSLHASTIHQNHHSSPSSSIKKKLRRDSKNSNSSSSSSSSSSSHHEIGREIAFYKFQALNEIESFSIKSVSSGKGFAALLTHDGRLFACGKLPYTSETELSELHRVFAWNNKKEKVELFSEVACGMYFMMVLSQDRKSLLSAGQNECGQRGIGRGGVLDFKECCFKNLEKKSTCANIKKITCGYQHTMILMNDDNFIGTGCSFQNQLGTIDSGICYEFMELDRPKTANCKIIDVQAGFFFTVCLDEMGMVYVTGLRAHSNLVDAHHWTMLSTFVNNPVESMCVSCSNSFFVTKSGTTFTNLNFDNIPSNNENLIPLSPQMGTIKKVFGKETFFAVNTNNEVFVSSSNGAQGLPSTTNSSKQYWIKHTPLMQQAVMCDDISVLDAFTFCVYILTRDEGVLKANLMTILRTQHQPKDDENDKNYFFDIEVKH